MNSIVDNPPLREEWSDNWIKWFSLVGQQVQTIDNSGATANRPTKGLFIGRQYFDTDLGYPVYLKSVRPNVWVNSAGTTV